MRHLNHLSIAMLVAGLLLVLGVRIFSLGMMWTLVGILVIWTGLIKIGMVAVWVRIAHMSTDQHRPIDEP